MTTFNQEDTRLLLHYLNNPPEPNENLKKLFQTAEKEINNRTLNNENRPWN